MDEIAEMDEGEEQTQAVASGVLQVTRPRRIKLLPGIRLNISKRRAGRNDQSPRQQRSNDCRSSREWIELHQFDARPNRWQCRRIGRFVHPALGFPLALKQTNGDRTPSTAAVWRVTR
jgi:hypothetical protein